MEEQQYKGVDPLGQDKRQLSENQKYTRKKPKPATPNESYFQHGKVPPQSVDLEEAVLGAMMLEKDALTEVIEILQPAVFYKESHQHIFTAIQTLFANSEPVDILTSNEQHPALSRPVETALTSASELSPKETTRAPVRPRR